MKNDDLKKQEVAAKKIVAKYGNSLGELQERGTASELKIVMMYIANESNHKQRILFGLDEK
ncbi:hypothetical protein [Lactiplantibacillus mudanjiangensis]|uniref:Uncharacterized protein n=1 Tax=Lactiplantibacillus mudanjiangensis TaxID=1296538 RepID=A0A660E4B7_9LACO|nr:hypothetical protein [Lactiplantibacillus mudanjiangensis]VDG24297.1 hypothetical protein MUDAN_IGPPGNFN_02559 [Lactiplantibacillus mudanjiangensis]VDG30440.1 hypothetical protein MUDAN_MDHGFNIF_01991 [Lactiplantibacillus mudanjiangensis]